MSRLKIQGDTSGVKKSILDLGKDLKSLGKTKISIFSDKDRKFIKEELGKELSSMKDKLVSNRTEISKMIKEQNKLEKGSKLELDHRKKIITSMQQQTKLAQQMDRLQKQKKDLGGIGGSGGSTGMGVMGKLASLAGGAALAVGGMAVVRGYQGAAQYAAGAKNRVRLKGLGVQDDNFGSPEALANAGLTEQDAINRRIRQTATLGRAGGSQESMMGQAKFERAYGLEEGSMMNVAGSLRGSFGGQGADQAQQKLQASILASGIEDAIGPYLESATDLLKDINENGVTNTDEMVRMFATMTKTGERTPEQIAAAFKGIDSAVKGSSGESNAFFQTAFARGGIGGGTIGATKLAMSSGGINGLNEEEMAKRGYNPELLQNMKGAGFMSGTGERTGAILDQFKKSAGLGKGQSISGVTDLNTMVGLSSMANSTLGTEGMGGFDALQMMEKVQTKQMSQKQFDDKLKEMKDNKDPSVERLGKINDSLAGQTTILRDINTNLLEALGKSTIKASNIATTADNMLVEGTGNVAGAIDKTGAIDAAQNGMSSMKNNLTGGSLGEKLYDFLHPDSISKAVETGMTKAMSTQKAAAQAINNNKVNVKVQTGDGRITNKTHK